MIRRIRSLTSVFCLLALSATPFSALHAQQQQKTVAVMSVSSVDDILGNIKYLSQAAGTAEAGGMVEAVVGGFLGGIDRGNPIGIVLQTDGQEFTPLGFVPVKDLDTVMSSVEDAMGTPRDAGDGIMEIPGFQPIFVKEQNGYAFIGQTIESMKRLPQNPVAGLGKLPQEYDLAIRGYVQNVPEAYLQMAVQGLQQGVRQGLESLPEEDRAQQQDLIELQLKQMETYIKESDQITLGWKTEPSNQRTYLDISFSALAGSDLAKQMNGMANTTSNYTNFIVPGAAVSLNFSGDIPPEQIQTSVDAIAGMKEAAMKEIAKDDSLDESGAREAAEEMLEAAIDILIETMKTGKIDAAASLVLDSGNPQLVAGFHVADGKQVEQMLRKIADLAKDEPKFPGINFNAANQGGVVYHTMEMPIPAGEEDARKIIGEKLEMAVGVGADSAYIGVGRDCVGNLQQIISKQTKNQKATPFEMTVAMTPIMEFVSSIEQDNPIIGSAVDALKEAKKDHVKLAVQPIENGFRYRVEVEEGILQAVGAWMTLAQ